jgi:hypothetical protein
MEVFKKMVPLIKEDYTFSQEAIDAWNTYHAPGIKRFVESHDDSFNDGIIIPFTCNFETFIFPVNDEKAYVESCNNHPWEEVFSDIIEDADNECKHYEDDKTMFVNVKTNKTCTAKGFTKKLYESYGITLHEGGD